MFTLSKASQDVKKAAIYLGFAIAAIVFVIILIRIIGIVKAIIFPAPPPTATSLFGILPPQVFPQDATNKNLTYSINTLSGYLPDLPIIIKVYRMQSVKPDLLAVQRLQDKVSAIGYPKDYAPVSDVVFEWKLDSEGLIKTLRGNALTGSLTITSDYLSNSDVVSGNKAPNEKKALDLASYMLSGLSLTFDDLDQTKIKTNLFSIANGGLAPATSPSTTQVIRVDYFQKDVDKYPIYYEKPDVSNINIFVAGGKEKSQIVAANFVHQTSTNESATYPLKTTAQAFEDLKQGKGYIASYNGTSNNIAIDNVTLAYYISSQQQDFLMPIFVFTGNDNFYAYVPAIKDESISK